MSMPAVSILYSTDHSALARRVFSEMSKRSRMWPDRRGFLIVPEFMKADTERRFLSNERSRGLMMAEILSFNRFAARLFSESGTFTRKSVSKAGKAVIAQKAIMNPDLPFRRFIRLRERPLYASELVRVLGDFNRYGITASDLYKASASSACENPFGSENLSCSQNLSGNEKPSPGDNPSVEATKNAPASADEKLFNSKNMGNKVQPTVAALDKFHDFALLKETLDSELEKKGLCDPDMTLSRLSDLLCQNPLPAELYFLRQSSLWVLGFGSDRNFTTQEYDVLKALASCAESLTVTVMADTDSSREEGIPAFQHGRDTLRSLSEIFKGAKKEKLPETEVRSPDIRLIRAVNTREETRFVAGEIRALLLEGQTSDVPKKRQTLRRRDIGIALCGDPELPDKLNQALNDYGVDAYLDIREPLLRSSFLRAAMAFLRLTRYDFTFDDLMDYYRCGLSSLSERHIDLFENAALALRWRTSRDFRLVTTFGEAELNETLRNGKINESDDEAIRTALDNVRSILKKTETVRRAYSGKTKCEKLLNLMFESAETESDVDSLEKRVAERRDELQKSGFENSAVLLVSAWNAAVDFLTESSKILGTTRISQAFFIRMIEAGLSGLELSSIPTGTDRVRVGTLPQMALWPCRVLYILGATASQFPPDSGQEGFLKDSEREILSDRLQKAFPEKRKNLPASQAWLVRMLLQNASDTLTISAPTLGDDKAPIFDDERVRKHVKEEIIVSEYEHIPDARWNAFLPARRMLLRFRKAPETWQTAIQEISGERENRKTEASCRNSERPNNGTYGEKSGLCPARAESGTIITPSRIRDAMLKRTGVSVSLLQSFNTCPFRFFADTILGARERDIAEDTPNRQGDLLHRMVELATTDLNQMLRHAPPGTEKATAEKWRQNLGEPYMRRLYEQAAETPGFICYTFPEIASVIGERMVLYVLNTLRVMDEFNKQEEYYPKQLEFRFGKDNLRLPEKQDDADFLQIHADGLSFILGGIIDRVDENPSGQIRLFDYKRTGKSFSWEGLYDGTDIQLPLYKAAYEKAYPKSHVDELYFSGFEKPSFKNLKTYENERSLTFNDSVKKLTAQKKVWENDTVDRVTRYAELKAQDTVKNILKGRFFAHPTIRGKEENAPCRYCAWRASCGRDRRRSPIVVLPSGSSEEQRVRENILNTEL